MDSDRHGPVGTLAADRPLLTSVVIAFGLTALSVIGFSGDRAAGVMVADFALNALVALALPAVLAAAAPTTTWPRIGFALASAATLYVAARTVPNLIPYDLSILSPNSASVVAAGGLTIWFLVLRPLFGDVAGLSFAAPVAAILGAYGAGALLVLGTNAPMNVVGALSSLSLAVACIVGVGVAAEFTKQFAKGDRVHKASGDAAHLAAAPAVYAALITAGVFVAGLTPGVEQLGWTWRAVIYAGAGVTIAAATALFITSATLSLGSTSEKIAVVENHRRQNFRKWWRPLRQALPPSSAIAFVAILLIVTIVALFEAYNEYSFAKTSLLIACAIAAGITFVSARTGLFVLLALFSSMILIDWSYELAGVALPGLLAELSAIAVAAALYGQIALAWRDARSPRRKAHEAAEVAMIDGAYRYLVSAAFAIAALLVGQTSGLWADGVAAGIYLTTLAVFGLLISAPLMTAISAIFGRD